MRNYLASEGDRRAVLLADFSGAQMATSSFITCMDLADANPAQTREAVAVSEAIFVVSAGDAASIEDARTHAAWLRHILSSLHRDESCGLLLVPVPGGVTAAEAEERVGLPICGILRTQNHTAKLARWIAQE